MPDNKLVIRRLPPSMSEDDLLQQISPLPEYDYFCFFEANLNLGPHSFSRAYINFLNSEDMCLFREKFDNHVFLDKDGHEYVAVVEQAMWHKSPKGGPFYVAPDSGGGGGGESFGSNNNEITNSAQVPAKIEDDPDFRTFIEGMHAQKKRPQQSPIQTLETNLDELTNSSQSTNSGGNKDAPKVITPLIGYVNQQRFNKGSKRSK